MIKPGGLIGRGLGTGRHLLGGLDVMVSNPSGPLLAVGHMIGDDRGDHVLVGEHMMAGRRDGRRTSSNRRRMMMVGMGLGQ